MLNLSTRGYTKIHAGTEKGFTAEVLAAFVLPGVPRGALAAPRATPRERDYVSAHPPW